MVTWPSESVRAAIIRNHNGVLRDHDRRMAVHFLPAYGRTTSRWTSLTKTGQIRPCRVPHQNPNTGIRGELSCSDGTGQSVRPGQVAAAVQGRFRLIQVK